jgi:preprotein translocase subunit SecF
LEITYNGDKPSLEEVNAKIGELSLGEFSVRPTEEKGYILRTKDLKETERLQVLSTLTFDNSKQFDVKRFDSIGPILGKELQRKALYSIILVILAIVIFITYAFRKVSKPVSSWKYGIVAIVALMHDVVVPAGVFSFLGRNGGFEADALFVTAILVVLGFSVHDTIVVFDRTRENLKIDSENRNPKPFSQIVGESLNQTFVRSITTSLTVFISLVVLYFMGAEATKNFSLLLLIGIAAGTYSSIFLASPLLVTIERWSKRND